MQNQYRNKQRQQTADAPAYCECGNPVKLVGADGRPYCWCCWYITKKQYASLRIGGVPLDEDARRAAAFQKIDINLILGKDAK